MNLSTVTVSPATLSANGTSTSIVTVQLKDSTGQNYTATVNGAMTFDAPTLGTLSTATNVGQGRWTATYTAGIVTGTTIIKAHFDGGNIAASAVITLLPNGFSEPVWFTSAWDIPTTADIAPTCQTTRPLTAFPVDLSLVTTAYPRGSVDPGSHTTPVPYLRLNMQTANGALDESGRPLVTQRVDVAAPSAATVTGGRSTEVRSSAGFTYTEYAIAMHVCGTKWLEISHVDGLSSKLAAAFDPVTTPGRAICTTSTDGLKSCTFDAMSIAVVSSERLGRSSGRTYGIDFGAIDASVLSTRRMHPKIWPTAWVASACPVNMYNTTFASFFFQLLPADVGCGEFAFDVAGTASGVWMPSDNVTNAMASEESSISLSDDYITSAQRVFSIGTKTSVQGLLSKIYYFTVETGSTHNTSFGSVRPGDVICYDQLRARGQGENDSPLSLKIFLRMTSGTSESLQIATGTGPCGAPPYAMPSAVSTFSRLTTSP